ncbi:MAG: PH domain-containing protein [Solirubrobacteraceae bacterium]|nr:PH domain-containing protein [Solirubrobacteraceae bacterium]
MTGLPGDAERIQLPERVVRYWRTNALIVWTPIVIAAVIGAVAAGDGIPGIAAVALIVVPLLAAIIDIAVVQPGRRRIWWYAIGEDQIDLQHGWIFVTRTVIPMTRVQHVEVQRGPVSSSFRLAELEIHTAAGSVKIPALDADEADRIRQQIADLARIADDL